MQATKSVKNPRKQRQRMFNAPAHLRHKLMSAHLAPDLMKSQGARSLPVRKGDTVRIMRGDHQGFEGKISRVDLANYRIFLEGLTREKVDGTVIFIAVHPSKVLIKTLNLDDKWRKRTLQRKKQLEMREESGLVVVSEEEEARPAKAKAKAAKEAAKPQREKAKPAEAKPKVTEAKPKRAAKTKAEKSVEKPKEEEIKPAEAKPEAPAEVKVAEKVEVAEEKSVVKKPRAAKKAVEKAEAKIAEEKPAPATKPARKPRAPKAAQEAATAEQKPTEAEAPAKEPAKKAPARRTAAKRKPKAAEKIGGA